MNREKRFRGFTITEIIIVIAIVGILVAILIPSLRGLRMKAKKTKELNVLKQVINAWTMYSNDHQNKLLAGYYDINVQAHESLAWAFPDESIIPPAPTYDSDYLNLTGPWPWRLLPYMSGNWRSLLFYNSPAWADFDEQLNAHANVITTEPAFGYNGFYLGGWKIFNSQQRVQTLFSNVKLKNDQKMNVVTTSLSQVNAPTTTIAFASTFLGEERAYNEVPNDTAGANFAIPSVFASEKRWSILPNGRINSLAATFVPLGRYNNMPAIGFADGHVNTVERFTLLNQKMWIPKARQVDEHPPEEFTHSH